VLSQTVLPQREKRIGAEPVPVIATTFVLQLKAKPTKLLSQNPPDCV
jgi:hypothetical protein